MAEWWSNEDGGWYCSNCGYFHDDWFESTLPGKCKKCGSEMGVSRDILIDRDYDLFKNLILADARNYPAWLLKLRGGKTDV